MRKLLTKILSLIVAVTAMCGLLTLPKTSVQANEFTFGAVAGASVKYGDTLEETGLRYTIEVDKTFYKDLGNGVVFGALISTKNYANSLQDGLVVSEGDENIADVRFIDDVTKFDTQQPADYPNYVYYASITYTFNDEWKAEAIEKYKPEMPNASDEEIFEIAKLEALSTYLVCRPYFVRANGEIEYANLSDARSMVKVANGAHIDGDPIDEYFVGKYLSTLVESESEVYVEKDGTVIGLSDADRTALTGASITADGIAEDIEFAIDNDVITNAETFLAGKEEGSYYYVTAFKGYEVYRIKYMYVTKAIDEASDLAVFVLNPQTAEHRLEGYYALAKDIDATGYKHGTHTFTSGGTTYSGSKDLGFSGTFDGNGHTISNFDSINNGLFGHATAPVIKNVSFVGVTITGYYGTLFAHTINRDGWDGKGYTKEAIFENVYVQVEKCIWGNSKRIGILTNNNLPNSVRIENVVVEYTNAKQDGVYDGVFAGTHEFGIIGGPGATNSMQKTLTFENTYAITDLPIMYSRGTYPYFAENQVEHTISNGYWIETVGKVYDERITEFLTARGKTLGVGMVARNLRTYENYVDMAGDFIEVEGEKVYANADSMLTFSNEYWTVVNGVPYWKTVYPSKVALTVVDKEGLPTSDIVLDNNTDTYEVNFVDASGFVLPELSISAPEGITVEGNKVRLTNIPLEATTYTIEVSALHEGCEIVDSFTISTVDAVDFIITDVKGNELNEILLESNREEVIFNFKHISGYYFESTTILPNDAIIVNGNRIKLAEDTSSKGSFDITVVGNIGGIEVTEVVTINYTNEVDVDEGNVLYSKDDLSLDLQSLKRALLTKGVEIHNLNSIKGYVVGETTSDVLDLEVIISGLNTYDAHDDTVDTIQEVKLLIGSKVYTINVLAYTKLIDEAQDLDYFRYKYNETGTVTLHDGYYLVTKNIDASNYEMKTHSFASNAVFPGSNSTHNDKKAGLTGVFDGNGYVIDDLSVQSNGIFAWINGGVVKDIAFTNVTLLAGSYPTLFAHSVDAGNTVRALFENIYVQVKSMAAESGVLVNNNMNGSYASLENVVIDFTSFGEKELGWLTTGGGRFGSVTDLNVNGGTYAANGTSARYPNLMKNVFSITSSPVVALRTSGTTISSLTVAGNQVSVTNNTEITVLDSKLNSLLSKFSAYTLTPENVQHGVKVYETFGDMANDYEANKAILDTFDDNWIVVDGVPYWKQLYYRNFDIEVNGESANSVFLPNNKVELEIDVVDMNGNSINPVITAPEGIILEGNKIKLANDPAFEGYYEVLFTAVVDGITIEKVLTVNFSNVINVDGHVLYSNMDKSLDVISLNKALEEVYVDPITLDQIDEYRVDGEVVDVLDLEVVISGQINQRTIKTYVVELVLDSKLYVLNNVGAYTLVLDDFADLDYISAPVDTVLPDGRVALAEYTGYYIMAKNLDGTGLGGVDKDGNPVNYTIAGSASADASKKVRGLSGVFDGNGYTISNAIVQSRGIFGMIKGGWLKNIGFKNMKLTGYYMCLLAQQFAYYNSNKTNEQGYITDIYVEGTDVSYISSNKEYGLLFQNQLYGYVERAVIKHTLNDTEKMYMKQGKRSGLFASQYNYYPQTGGVQVHLNRWIVIGDTPVAYDNTASAAWNKFVFAKNMLKTNANGELELIDPTSFSFINELFTQTTGEGESAVRVWQPVFNGSSDVVNKVDEAQYVRQYISDEAMANDKEGCAEMLSYFTSPYWVISESGTIAWRTAN